MGLDGLRNSEWGTFLESLRKNKHQEPKIKVTIKPRAKDHPTDEFKLNIKYEIDLSEQEKSLLDSLVPAAQVEAS